MQGLARQHRGHIEATGTEQPGNPVTVALQTRQAGRFAPGMDGEAARAGVDADRHTLAAISQAQDAGLSGMDPKAVGDRPGVGGVGCDRLGGEDRRRRRSQHLDRGRR